MTLAELRAALEAIQTEMRAIDETAGDSALTPEQQTRWNELDAERVGRESDIAAFDARSEVRSAIADRGRRLGGIEAGQPPEVITRDDDPFAILEDRSLTGRARTRALIDANVRAMDEDDRIEDGDNQAYFERTLRRHTRGPGGHAWAANLLARSRDEYLSGFSKAVTGNHYAIDNEERAALAVGTSTNGGLLVPTHLDPTLILTNAGSSNVMRPLASVRQLVEGNVWHGATSAGATASWDGELVEVSDDTPAVASQSITLYKAQAFIQASVEALQDISGLATDVMMLLADARDRLEGAAHMTGTGSQPQGLFTVINASSTLQTVSTTGATIGLVDIHALYRSLPIRWRSRGTWVMNPLYSLAIKSLGTALSASYTTDLTQGVAGQMLSHTVVESDDAPTTQTTTALDQEVIFADLSQFIIIDKPGGMSIEFIPQLFNTANNLPDGRKGWFAYWRTGSGMPALQAGRSLVDKTTA